MKERKASFPNLSQQIWTYPNISFGKAYKSNMINYKQLNICFWNQNNRITLIVIAHPREHMQA